ncbi:nitroreductase family protein [Fodinibius saliphilus]|uniref:nitroreductase family protein n=1 Tax=Fodinibius saliphilus TaxID=1920650 RepID=UPI001109FE77|nr:nitroreductase family protein [Fodinibius saliphilus]
MATTLKKTTNKTDIKYPIHDLLQKRWSPRAFSDKSIEPELLKQLFEAARWAPSSYNEQPWHFIAARKEDEEAFKKLSAVMNDFNRGWALAAPVLVLGLTKTTFEMNENSNPHAGHDLGQAISHLTFEASRHDLYVHQMAGILPDKAREIYDIAENVEPMTMFAIGYKEAASQLDDGLQEKEQAPNERKPLSDILTLNAG